MSEAGLTVEKDPLLKRWSSKAGAYHDKVPLIRQVPKRSIAIILLLVLVNIVVWIAAGVVLHYNPGLASTCVLSWVLGLRHALDADHISAIDLMTRRLVASGKQPVTVGTWFSLGHSTIVIITSIVVAATANAISNKFDDFTKTGNIIGTSVSAAFLIILGCMNVYILISLGRELRRRLKEPAAVPGSEAQQNMAELADWQRGGCLFSVLHRLFKLVDKPWKMYPIGVLFGLGFDTSSEIALLGIASIEATRGTSIWLILIFPLLFTAGMCLLDTTDGALMMALYTRAAAGRDPLVILYYSIVLTAVTVLVALAIGVLQLLGLVLNVTDAHGRFWAGVENAGEHYDIIGGAICGSFVVFGVLGVLLYKPWRRWVEARRPQATTGLDEESASIDTAQEPQERGRRDVKSADNDIVETPDTVHPSRAQNATLSF